MEFGKRSLFVFIGLDHVFKFKESDLQLAERESEGWVPPETLQSEHLVGLKWSRSGLIPDSAHTMEVLKCEAAFHGSSSLFSFPCPWLLLQLHSQPKKMEAGSGCFCISVPSSLPAPGP